MDSLDVGSEFGEEKSVVKEERQNVYFQSKRNMEDLFHEVIPNKELARNRNLKEFSDMIMRKS